LIGSWYSGNGGAVEYVSDDVAVGTYAIKNSNPDTSYFAGVMFRIPGAPLDLSNPSTLISFKEKLTFASGLEYVHVQYRIYTDTVWNSNFTCNDMLTSGSWSQYTTGLNVHEIFTVIDGTPDWSHVYGLGFFVTQNMPGNATTVTVDGLNLTVPEPLTISMLILGSVTMLGRRGKHN
jgi:hypothetical protein